MVPWLAVVGLFFFGQPLLAGFLAVAILLW